MNPTSIDTLIENLDADYKDLIFGDFFEEVFKILSSDLNVTNEKSEEVSYLLTLYFIFVLNRYELIDNLARELNLSLHEVSGAVFRMLNNLPSDLVADIEATYREGVTDKKFLELLDALQAMNQVEVASYLEKIAYSTQAIQHEAAAYKDTSVFETLNVDPVDFKRTVNANPTIEHEGVAYKATPVSESLNADPLEETKPTVSSTPGIRTMARDIQAISTHDDVVHTAASQDDILQKPPADEVPTGPRWDSE